MKAVLFDLDGVVTDTAEYHYIAWKALASKLGIEIDREFNEKLKGVSRTDSLDLILEYGNQADKYTQAEKDALAAEKNDFYVESIQKMTSKDILPGIVELLNGLKAQGYKTSLASASKNGPMILNLLGIADLFDAVANPAEVKAGKPAPDIFLKAAELVGATPRECVGVEDAASGVSAIKSAGMVAVAVGSPTQLSEADKIVASTGELNCELIEEAWSEYHA